MTDVPFVIRLLADTSYIYADMDAVEARTDEVVSRWKTVRQEVINGLSALNQSVMYTFQGIRLAARAAGATIAPIHNALMGVITGTTSLMLSTATLMASTSLGILAGVAVALAAFALGFQIAETAKLTVEMIQAQEKITSAEQAVARIQQHLSVPRF